MSNNSSFPNDQNLQENDELQRVALESNLAGLNDFYRSLPWLLIERSIGDLQQPPAPDAAFNELICSTMPEEEEHSIGAPDRLGVISVEAQSCGEPENNDEEEEEEEDEGALSTNDGLADTSVDFQAMAGPSDGSHDHPHPTGSSRLGGNKVSPSYDATPQSILISQQEHDFPATPMDCKLLAEMGMLVALSIAVFVYDSGVAKLQMVHDANMAKLQMVREVISGCCGTGVIIEG